MAIVLYGGKALIPAPMVSLRKEYQKAEDGTILGALFTITLKGKIVAYKGSPSTAGVFWNQPGYPPDESVPDLSRLKAILRKIEAVRQLFSVEGQSLEFQPLDGTQSMKCNPRIRDIEFPQGSPTSWYENAEYTIVLEADQIFGGLAGLPEDSGVNGGLFISKAQEDWVIEAADETARTLRLTHSLSATGKKSYDVSGNVIGTSAWENAQVWVQARQGIDLARLIADGTLNLPTPQAFNYIRSEHTNKLSGTFSITETWLCFDTTSLPAPAIEDFTVQTRTEENGRIHVTIEGSVKGLQVSNNTTYAIISTRYANASTYWDTISSSATMLARAQIFSGASLNPQRLSSTTGRNQFTGVITYNFEYNDRPTLLIAGAINESITVAFNRPSDVFASIVVLGRAAGPVLQSIGTVTSSKKSLSVEATMPAGSLSGGLPNMPNTNSLVASYAPAGTTYLFLEQDNESWSAETGKYSRNTSWVYQ